MCNSAFVVDTHVKVFYTPIEAAIRWCNLVEYEGQIIPTLHGKNRLSPRQFPQWPQLHLNLDRIFDGLIHGDLSYGRNGVTANDPKLLSEPDLTIRHVDLRAWMSHHYPDQRPAFLFDAFEQILHPAITVEMIQALIGDRELLRATYSNCQRSLDELRSAHSALQQDYARQKSQQRNEGISQRAEATYLNIIGALLQLMLDQAPSGIPYSRFKSQEAIISALVAHHGSLMGITTRTLHAKFAEANRRLAAQIM